MTNPAPRLTDVYLFVRDMSSALAFYRHLGVTVNAAGENFARAVGPDGALGLEFGTYALTQSYDPNWREPDRMAKSTLNFKLASRDAVDDLYAELTAAGYYGHLPPTDAFWGARFAIIDDPDGNQVGLQSPQDPERAFPPSVR